MIRIEQIWEPRNRTPVLLVSALIILAIAVVDWVTKPYVSLGFLYLFPIMMAAAFIPRWMVVVLGAGCSVLTDLFSYLGPEGRLFRLTFATMALVGCGLFVSELVRNRRLRIAAQERLRALVETSPAAIVTVDERGFIELANRAAADLFLPRDGSMAGHPVAAFVPELHHALRREEGPQFRTSMQCLAHRDNGESFMADIWFSTYREGDSPKLAAIVGETAEESVHADAASEGALDRVTLSSRETDVLRFLVQGLANKEIAVRLDISESAVKNTLQQLFGKTGVRTRSQIVRVALERYRDLL